MAIAFVLMPDAAHSPGAVGWRLIDVDVFFPGNLVEFCWVTYKLWMDELDAEFDLVDDLLLSFRVLTVKDVISFFIYILT